jgi:hypothetical protein
VDTFRAIRRVLWVTMGLNLVATAAKLIVGYWTGSLSLIADGVDSVFDAASNVVGLVGIHSQMRPWRDVQCLGFAGQTGPRGSPRRVCGEARGATIGPHAGKRSAHQAGLWAVGAVCQRARRDGLAGARLLSLAGSRHLPCLLNG